MSTNNMLGLHGPSSAPKRRLMPERIPELVGNPNFTCRNDDKCGPRKPKHLPERFVIKPSDYETESVNLPKTRDTHIRRGLFHLQSTSSKNARKTITTNAVSRQTNNFMRKNQPKLTSVTNQNETQPLINMEEVEEDVLKNRFKQLRVNIQRGGKITKKRNIVKAQVSALSSIPKQTLKDIAQNQMLVSTSTKKFSIVSKDQPSTSKKEPFQSYLKPYNSHLKRREHSSSDNNEFLELERQCKIPTPVVSSGHQRKLPNVAIDSSSSTHTRAKSILKPATSTGPPCIEESRYFPNKEICPEILEQIQKLIKLDAEAFEHYKTLHEKYMQKLYNLATPLKTQAKRNKENSATQCRRSHRLSLKNLQAADASGVQGKNVTFDVYSQAEGQKMEKAKKMYNDMREVFGILRTPKRAVNLQGSMTPDTPTATISKNLQKQLLLLQDTPSRL